MTTPAIIITVGICLLIISAVPYPIYIFGIAFGKKKSVVPTLTNYPPISIVMSAYNEAENIESRLKNINGCKYPGKQTIIFVDDKSSDDTEKVAQEWLNVLGFSYHIITNPVRMGTNASYNRAITAAETDIVVVTDADVLFGKNALVRIIDRLESNERIGAVSGDLQPSAQFRNTTAVMEHNYRSVYGKMCEWESAHDSTFNFNGALMAFRKSAVNWVDQKTGADDANIAFAVIRNGYRSVYENNAVVFEDVPASIDIQFRQKVRRAKGLIEAIISNIDILHSGRPFAWFYAIRIWMLIVSPSLFFAGIGVCIIASYLSSFNAGITISGVVVIMVLFSTFARAFVINQAYLIAGLFSRRNAQVWESTSSVKKHVKDELGIPYAIEDEELKGV